MKKSYNQGFDKNPKDYMMEKLSLDEIKKCINTSPSKGRDMLILGEQNFTPEVVEYIEKSNKKVAVEILEPKLSEELGLKYPNDAKAMIDFSAIRHSLNRHGEDSKLVKSNSQLPITYNDLANYRNIVKAADETIIIAQDNGLKKITSYKQVDGYFVVVEQVSKKHNGLSLVTMFKEKGDYKNGNSYKRTIKHKRK